MTPSFRTVDGTAKTGDSDYVAKTGTLTFAPGETMKTITIEVKGDSKKEANETFYLDLFGLSSNCAVHQEPRPRHDLERRLIRDCRERPVRPCRQASPRRRDLDEERSNGDRNLFLRGSGGSVRRGHDDFRAASSIIPS